MTASVLDVTLNQQAEAELCKKRCDCCSKHSRDAEEVESHCSLAYELEQILCVQKSEFRSSPNHPSIQINVNHSHRLIG